MEEKNNKPRAEGGRFAKGNTVGEETRFKNGHTLSSTYDESYPEDLIKYFREKIEEGDVPFLEMWAVSKNLSYRTVMLWSKNEDGKHAQFAYAYEQCKCMQSYALMHGGLKGSLQARIVEFLLKNMHGMKDKVENEISGEGITVNIREVN